MYYAFLIFLAGMHFQDFLRSLCTCAELKGTDSENPQNLWPALPSPSSFTLLRSSLLGLGAVASLAAYYLVVRPRPMHPPCDLQAQSLPVNVSESQLRRGGSAPQCRCYLFVYAGRSQLQTVGSSQRWFAAGVLLRGHQDVLWHVPTRTGHHR